MPYVIDRNHAVDTAHIVAILSIRQRKIRSRVVFVDNSLYHTLTRPKTFLNTMHQAHKGVTSTSRAVTAFGERPPSAR